MRPNSFPDSSSVHQQTHQMPAALIPVLLTQQFWVPGILSTAKWGNYPYIHDHEHTDSNFTFFFANEYFFFRLPSNSALRLLLGLIRCDSLKSRSANFKTQVCRLSSSGEVEEGIWIGQWGRFLSVEYLLRHKRENAMLSSLSTCWSKHEANQSYELAVDA